MNPSEKPTADVSPAAAAELRASGAVTVVDVREPGEWTAGHIDGAVLIPLGTPDPVTIGTIDGSKPVVAVCRSGKRSARAAEILRAAGLTVHNMTGGMIDWVSADLPVHTGVRGPPLRRRRLHRRSQRYGAGQVTHARASRRVRHHLRPCVAAESG